MNGSSLRDMAGHPGSRTYLRLWASQMLSSLGSEMTNFAMAVHLYQQTGQVGTLAVTLAFAVLPRTLALLVAGGAADRYDRKAIILGSELVQALTLVALMAAFNLGRLEPWVVWLGVALNTTATVFQSVATATTVPLLVPAQHLPRAGGLQSLAEGAQHVAGPVLGGLLYATLGLGGVFVVDLLTYTVNLANLADIRLPVTPRSPGPRRVTILEDARVGWGFIRSSPGLLGMVGLWLSANLIIATEPLYRSVVLANTGSNAGILGFVAAGEGAGAILGGFLMTLWGGPKRLVNGVLGGIVGIGLFAMVFMGFARGAPLWFAANVLGAVFFPVYLASLGALLQRKTPTALMGRVVAFRRLLAICLQPVVLFGLGPLVTGVFDPLMGGPLGRALEPVLGAREGRGSSLLLIVLGLALLLAAGLTYLNPRVRNLETELPDAPRQG